MYQFATWKYWLVIAVLLAGFVFALPNVFGEDPALQLSRQDRAAVGAPGETRVRAMLQAKGIVPVASYFISDRLVLRFKDADSQRKAREIILAEAPGEYIVALTRASRMPEFLRALGLKPMSLGLDLRGGVHFLYEVDVKGAVSQALQNLERDFRAQLRDARIPYVSVTSDEQSVSVVLRNPTDVAAATKLLQKDTQGITLQTDTGPGGAPLLRVRLTPQEIKRRQDAAIQQNIITMRKRVDELGVSEPIVARQGTDRIVVQLPGIQDPNEAIRVLGATATLEFRLVDETHDPYEAERTKRVPVGAKLYHRREGGPVLLKRDIIVSGDQLTDATSAFVQGEPAVSVRLDSRGGARMLKTTQEALGHAMAVVFIEKKKLAEGETCMGQRDGDFCTKEEVISVATIRGVFSSSFQITGLQAGEAKELALLLRAGSLAVPNTLIEQRTVGPSLGQDNIDRGVRAMIIGMLLTFAFLAVYYRAFGWIANAVLLSNIVLTVGLLSLLQASLSFAGIAAVVFHMGIAVDANILIYERIREELRNGNSPLASINAGFEKAFATIADSNVTTLIAGVVLFVFGTGPIRSFAIVMTLGIITSMFTAILGSRALIHFIWGRRRRLERLSI
jgi:preprotein translocase subunit SecD